MGAPLQLRASAQGIGEAVPWERFRLAAVELVDPVELVEEPTTTRRVGHTGKISFAAASYRVGVWLDSETVEVFSIWARCALSITNPDTFLCNSGPITALNSPSWNRRRTYRVTMAGHDKDARGFVVTELEEVRPPSGILVTGVTAGPLVPSEE